jgi:predicted anti-sigma-YlaC factor YlaD
MSDHFSTCTRLEEALLEGELQTLPDALREHSATCPDCREQVAVHGSLLTAFAGHPVPELSASFDAQLGKKLRATKPRIHPLSGWRLAAMLGYAAIAILSLDWALRDVPLPAIDPSSPWVAAAAFLAVPLTLALAVTASRWLPGPGMWRSPMALGL